MKEDIEKFKQEHCKICNNKNSNLCEIRVNVNNKLQCIHEERCDGVFRNKQSMHKY